jgi:hypothetical protein
VSGRDNGGGRVSEGGWVVGWFCWLEVVEATGKEIRLRVGWRYKRKRVKGGCVGGEGGNSLIPRATSKKALNLTAL